MTAPSTLAFSRVETDVLKGLAILGMFVHHLFALPGLIRPPAEYLPLLPGMPLEYMLGRYGKVVVAIFLMISGYGLARAALAGAPGGLRRVLARLLQFAGVFWFCFAVLVPIGALFFSDRLFEGTPRYALDPYRLVPNALMLRHDYNYEWWFTEAYALVLLASPVLLALALARRMVWAVPVSLGLFGLGAVMDMLRLDPEPLSLSAGLIWQFPFVMGALIARHGDRVALTAPRAAGAAVLLGAMTLVVEAMAPFAMTPALILSAPLSAVLWIWAARHMGRMTRPLAALGALSLPLWLIHSFFAYYFLQTFIYAPRLSLLVMANLLACSVATAWGLEWLRRAMLRGVAVARRPA